MTDGLVLLAAWAQLLVLVGALGFFVLRGRGRRRDEAPPRA